MKVLFCWLLLGLFAMSLGADARVNIRFFDKHVRVDGEILSDACVMSYTDRLKGVLRVIRGNPITIHLK